MEEWYADKRVSRFQVLDAPELAVSCLTPRSTCSQRIPRRFVIDLGPFFVPRALRTTTTSTWSTGLRRMCSESDSALPSTRGARRRAR